MKIAILTVFWNSNVENYLMRYFFSLKNIKKHPKIKIKIFILNNSKNPTLQRYIANNNLDLNNPKIDIFECKIDGFARSNNYLAKIALNKFNPDYFLFLNPDTEIEKNAINQMINVINVEPDVFCVDARQLPFEHPKWFDKKNLNTSWCSGSCLFVRVKQFIELGGFNEKFIIYAEDVDLSWKAWESGYKCKHAFQALCTHHCYGTTKNAYFRQFWNVRNGLIMRYVHGDINDLINYTKILFSSFIFALKQFHFKEVFNIFRAMFYGYCVGVTLNNHLKYKKDNRPYFARFVDGEYAYHRKI